MDGVACARHGLGSRNESMVEYLFNVKFEGRVRAGFRLQGLCGE